MEYLFLMEQKKNQREIDEIEGKIRTHLCDILLLVSRRACDDEKKVHIEINLRHLAEWAAEKCQDSGVK